MADKYQGKYRIPSARLAGWDYGNAAGYFVTICTAHRETFFGKIIDGLMHLSIIGKIAHDEWFKTTAIRPDMNLVLDEFVVMPNHIHGIVGIGENEYNTGGGVVGGGRDAMHRVSTGSGNTIPNNHFGPQSKNLASIVRGYKSSVTTHARKMGDVLFGWQSRFHDHIIRDADEYERIAYYIRSNPENWKDDKFYRD